MDYLALCGLILLATFPAGLMASPVFAAGNFSFNTSQEKSFWSSEMGNYTFGFQAVNAGGRNYLLSIWHSADPNKTAIWWPLGSNDVDYDPLVKAGSTLHFTSTGTLKLLSPNGALLWSTNTTSSYAMLQDTGNLVLYQNNSSIISWQSFSDSRDSLILSYLDSNTVGSKPYLLQSRRNQSSYSTGPFHLQTDSNSNVYLIGLDALGNDFIYLIAHINTDGGFWVGMDYGNNYTQNTSLELKRLTLDYDGNLRVYKWESNVSSWSEKWQILDRKCMLGSPCGPFGICEEDEFGKPHCSCPPSYHAQVAANPSQGCISNISFNASCGLSSEASQYNTTMVEVPHSDYFYNDLERENVVDIDECKTMCLKRCADCMAATFNEDQNACFLKGSSAIGYLMNGFASNSSTLLIKVVNLEVKAKAKKDRGWVIGVVIAILLFIVACSSWLLWKRRATAKSLGPLFWLGRPKHKYEDAGPVRFYGYDELMAATRNFSERLGEGGFGTVYKGYVKHENREFGIEQKMTSNENENKQLLAVAVKVLNSPERKRDNDAHDESYSQFKSEINTLGKIHHVNLVSLVGYSCSTTGALHGKDRLLVYEYMENGSLDKYLSTSEYAQLELAWGTRYSIALGIARGIAYLHHECSPPILHCDIKPHNVLLDAQFTAKVADFGFARRFRAQSHISMSGIRGTWGYIAPEWLTSDELSFKVDVYSFGKLLLELVRGFKNRGDLHMSLDEWATKCISKGAVREFPAHLDVQVVKDGPRDDALMTCEETDSELVQEEANEKLRLLKVGMWCIQHKPSMRPLMSRVVQLIEGTITMEDPPIPPVPSDLPNPTLPLGRNQSSSSSSCMNSSILSGR